MSVDKFERKHAVVGGIVLACIIIALVTLVSIGPVSEDDPKDSSVYNQDLDEGFDGLQYSIWNASDRNTLTVNYRGNYPVKSINNSVTIRASENASAEGYYQRPVHITNVEESQFEITEPTRFETVTIGDRYNAYGFVATDTVEFQNSILLVENKTNYTVKNADRAEFNDVVFEVNENPQNAHKTLHFENVDRVEMEGVSVNSFEGIQITLDNSTLVFDGQTVKEDVDTVYMCGSSSTNIEEGSELSIEEC